MISRNCFTAVSALVVYNIFFKDIYNYCDVLLEFLPICFTGDEFAGGVENDKDASNVIFTGKWSESSSKSGSW